MRKHNLNTFRLTQDEQEAPEIFTVRCEVELKIEANTVLRNYFLPLLNIGDAGPDEVSCYTTKCADNVTKTRTQRCTHTHTYTHLNKFSFIS